VEQSDWYQACRMTLEAVDEFNFLAAHARHHRRELPPTPQRSRHRFLRLRIDEAITPITLTQAIKRLWPPENPRAQTLAPGPRAANPRQLR
jgi:hypothetical protein